MNSNTRSRRAGAFLATLAAVMLAAPTAVLAHEETRRDRRHDDRQSVTHDFHRPWYGSSMRARLARAGRVHRSTRYYCKPCNHGFHSSREFRWHVHQRHHIPLWRVPFVIAHGVVHGVFAWVFAG